MLPLGSGTILSAVLSRMKAVPAVDVVVAAVPASEDSGPVARHAAELGAVVVRGSEHDVLERFRLAAASVKASIILRVTSDCPLADPDLCGQVIACLRQSGASFACNNDPRVYPHGLDCEVFTRELLDRAAAQAVMPHDREHVGPWMRRAEAGRIASIAENGEGADQRWTVDYPEDLAFVRQMWPLLDDGRVTAWRDVLRIVRSHPDIEALNRARRAHG